MLKTIPWIFLLLPLTKSYAEQEKPAPSNHQDQVVNDSESLSVEQVISPRSRDDFFRQCYINVPAEVRSTETRPNNQIPVNIDALSVSGSKQKYIYQDDVNLLQGDKKLTADQMTYYVDQERATAIGNVNFVNGEVTLYSDDFETYLNNDQSTLNQAEYQFHGRGGRGVADRIFDNGQDLYELNSSSYTACPPEDTTWRLDATTLYIDNTEEVGSAYNAVLRVKDVPVFYFPYVSYPLTDKRKTGLLFPNFEISDTNGFTYTQPIYINIAPNMDATITPTYIQKRGTKIAGEYRYLSEIGSGSLQAEYLADDKIRGYNRYLYHWDHNVSFAQHWNFNARYNQVSDDDYFNDLDTPYGDRSDNQLLQTAKLSYQRENWNSELEVRSFQILGTGDTPHIVMPKLAFSAYQPIDWKSLQFDLYSEITQFDHDDDNVYTGTRIHMEPKISLPLYYNSMFINTELKYMLSFYEQTIPDANKEDWYSELEESTSRYIPSFKINAGVNFERDFKFMGANYRQTLVPQFQYLYVPYEDQSSIGIYDTTTLQQDYYGLFRDNRYSGYDRIADANQITIGVSSSFLDNRGKEKMRFAIGQNYYIESSKVHLPQNSDQVINDTRSSLIGEFDMNFKNNYFLHAGMEWDTDNNVIKRANTTLEKRWLNNTYAQVNYRYIALNEESVSDNNQGLVNQLGTKMNWSINSQWTAYASYYHDVEYNQTFESIVGIQYQSCCWSIGLSIDEHMLAYYGDLNDIKASSETEQSIKLNIELMGLGGVGFSSGDQGLFDYGRPFYLK
ncbi:LPS assembly protein LptD [Psychromonas sp. psych-6C06]|uniref:LPS assembly protein LptD n=1 Tax=Psychromonas sp. psych-6C06 TaxID=2058089 RepID=UPI000C327C10|nr:LPS assembly protein LptD [Psychromonas sp. psych-6C06]PKF62634.1 LPS assembly protein LptD [Psychromonas sp. psych-6C06]